MLVCVQDATAYVQGLISTGFRLFFDVLHLELCMKSVFNLSKSIHTTFKHSVFDVVCRY